MKVIVLILILSSCIFRPEKIDEYHKNHTFLAIDTIQGEKYSDIIFRCRLEACSLRDTFRLYGTDYIYKK